MIMNGGHMYKRISVVLAVAIMTACSSTGVRNFQKDEVLSTLNDQDKPDRADEGHPITFKNDKLYSVGVAYIQGSERPEAGARISSHNAKANIAKSIETKIESI